MLGRRPLLLTLLAAALTGACSEISNGAGQTSQKIGQITHDPAATQVNLPQLTSFGWDYFYFFKAGTTREQICTFIEAKRTQCGRVIRYAAVPEGYVALFFGLRGQLTHTELHDLGNGEFDFTVPEHGFPRQRSVFIIRRATSGTAKDRILLEAP